MNNPKRENPFISLLCNIVIPVAILNKGHLILENNLLSLLLALAFPVFYGLFDLLKNKRKNIISGFGVLNVLFTGGLALFQAQGIWFAVKEAAFPGLIGIFVLISAYTKKSFFEYILREAPLLKWDLVEERLKRFSSIERLKTLFKKSTLMFSFSFFISALLNFVLALYIFSPEKGGLSPEEQEVLLNKKIADMTYLGFIVIGLPMTAFALAVFWWFLKKLSRAVQLPIEQILSAAK